MSDSSFLAGGGAVGELMRTQDWSASPLGAPDTWPQALRTVVALMLNSKFPMFVAWGPELGFLYNDSYTDVLQAKHPHAMGRRFADIWAEIWHDVGPLADRAMQGEATYLENLPLRMNRRGYDEDTWFTFSYSPVRDEHGAVRGVYCACVETTAQVLAERYRDEENERLRTMFEQAPGFIAMLSGPQHRFALTNKAYMQLVGHRDILGKHVRDALPEVAGQGFVDLLDEVYRTGRSFVGSAMLVKLQRAPDSPLVDRYVDFVYQPVFDAAGKVIGIFAEGNDVTERKQAEDELRAANRQKDQFLAMLAHELRNPLAPITSAAQLLRAASLDPAAVRRASEIISRQAEHMTELVNDLLDVSRVTRGLVTLEKEELDVNAVVTHAVEQVRSLVEARRHALTMELSGDDAHVAGDRTRLVQIVSNILNNAAKYTPAGGRIGLTVRVDADIVEVTVRDNGMGIPADVLPYVFDLFTQAERTPDRSQGGLGIGLALVRSLVALHGGTVRAASAGPNLGSEFTVALPRVRAKTAQATNDGAAPTVAGVLRILVVDDNVDAAQTLGMLLEMQGHTVMTEFDGESALRRARQERPRVMLLDIGLPDMDGYELARRLRAVPETRDAVLIALTGYGQAGDRERTRAAGFDYHLVKPASMTQVLEVLAEVATR